MHDLRQLLGPTGTASTSALADLSSSRSVERWTAAGRLVRLHPGWVTVPELAQDWTVLAHAATGYSGGPLSHLSALRAHQVVDVEVSPLDVTVPTGRRVRTSRRLRVHRTQTRLAVVRAGGLAATTIPRALIDTWGEAHRSGVGRSHGELARAALLRATRGHRTSTAAIDIALATRPELPGRIELLGLLGLIAGGCQSELEVFGVQHVLRIPGLPPCEQQHRLLLPSGPVRLDAAWPEVKLAVELDGAAFHGSQEARERDLQRDAALAARGWLVLRFSYRRLTRHPDACRAQIAAVYRARLTTVR